MTYKKFLELCKSCEDSEIDGGVLQEQNYWGSVKEKDNEILFVSWSTGGISGGNCWDSDAAEPYESNDIPKELVILDKILEKINPNINFLEYRNLSSELVKQDYHTEYEYYGNQTDYSYKMVCIKDLYDYLIKKDWLS